MMGMEKMLSSFVGMTPEELKQTAANVQLALETTVEKLIAIHADTQTIIAKMEAKENERGK